LSTNISQTVSWADSNSSISTTTRSFAVEYIDSVGTFASTLNGVNDFDYLAVQNSYGFPYAYLSPVIPIYPQYIFNKIGERGSASYLANGAYFYNQQGSSVEFVTTQYSFPISLDVFNESFNDVKYSNFSIFTSQGYGNIFSSAHGLRAFIFY
jgi:hypothetical protein